MGMDSPRPLLGGHLQDARTQDFWLAGVKSSACMPQTIVILGVTVFLSFHILETSDSSGCFKYTSMVVDYGHPCWVCTAHGQLVLLLSKPAWRFSPSADTYRAVCVPPCSLTWNLR